MCLISNYGEFATIKKKQKIMTPKVKENQILEMITWKLWDDKIENLQIAKKCAILTIKNEYYSNRELLFNLKASGFDIEERFYLSRLQGLIDEEKEVIRQIKKVKLWEI